jgi:exonuclease SbcC
LREGIPVGSRELSAEGTIVSVTNERLPSSAETLTDWRAAERALSTATANREASELAAEAAALAEQAATRTAEAARTALEAATRAEETARRTAEAASSATVAARGELMKRQGAETDAIAAEDSARDAYRAAEERARNR